MEFTKTTNVGEIEIVVHLGEGTAWGEIIFPKEWTLKECLDKIDDDLNWALRRDLGNINRLSIEIDHDSVDGLTKETVKPFNKMPISTAYGELVRWYLSRNPSARGCTIGGCLV